MRLDRLRDLVDELPPKERHMVERVFFGQATILRAGAEAKLNAKQARITLAQAFERLKKNLLEDDEMGKVLPAGFFDRWAVHLPSGVEGPQRVTGLVLRAEDSGSAPAAGG